VGKKWQQGGYETRRDSHVIPLKNVFAEDWKQRAGGGGRCVNWTAETLPAWIQDRTASSLN
jgi:hypothetical protein